MLKVRVLSRQPMYTIYSFKCKDCGKGFEQPYNSLSVHPIVLSCKYCGSNNVHRDYKAENVGVVFVGKGFYSTDNRK